MVKEIKTQSDLYYCLVQDLNKMLHEIDPMLIDEFVNAFQRRIRIVCAMMNFDQEEVEGMIRFFIKHSNLHNSVVLIEEQND